MDKIKPPTPPQPGDGREPRGLDLVPCDLRQAGLVARRKLQKSPRDPAAISRLGGPPIGVDRDTWPLIFNPETGAEQPMLHVLTVDLRELGIDAGPGIVALALFAASPSMPLYFDDPTADYAVIPLRQADLDRGELAMPELPEPALPAHGLTLGRGAPGPSNFAGGSPRALQDELDSDGFVLQVNERLVPLNLGDSGELYMYTTWAVWQSH